MSAHDNDTFEEWKKENQSTLEFHKVNDLIARMIFDAGRVSAFNHYIRMISNGELLIP